MMQRIAEKRTTVVMPIIDSIRPTTFEHLSTGIGCTLGFIWSLVTKKKQEKKNRKKGRKEERKEEIKQNQRKKKT